MWDDLSGTVGTIWDETLQFGAEAAETVSEGASAYLKSEVASKTNPTKTVKQVEASADPNEAAKKEPIKGKNANGETMVAKRPDGRSDYVTLSKQDALLYAGVGLAVFALILALGSK